MGENALEISGLSKRFGKTTAVNDMTISVRRGEMFGLVGPDGAGKTTTVRMLCGIVQPDAGDISVLGFDLRSELGEIKRRIGYLSQRFSLYGDLTIDENIEFVAEIHQVVNYRERREELLQFTRLTPFRDRLAERLSGGMKQKLALACVLMHTPEMILLDEPTVGVDPVSRRDFWVILSQLGKKGITIVITTPYLDEAERCMRIALMNDGRVLVCDAPARIKRLMKGCVVEIVCDEIRRASKTLKQTRGISEVQVFGDRLNVVVGPESLDMDSIRNALSAGGIRVEGLREVTPSIENVFISMVEADAALKA